VAQEAAAGSPIAESDQHGRESEHLPDFHAHVETDNVRDESVLRQIKLLKLGGQTETVEQAENQDGELSVGLKSQKPFETVHVVEGFVHHREADDRIDDVGVRVDISEDARQKRDAVPQREEADVLDDVLEPVEEEDNTHQKRQVIISGHHVLGSEVHKRGHGDALVGLDEGRVALGDVVRGGSHREKQSANQDQG